MPGCKETARRKAERLENEALRLSVSSFTPVDHFSMAIHQTPLRKTGFHDIVYSSFLGGNVIKGVFVLLRICLPLTVAGCGRNAADEGNETICVLSLIY